MGTGERDSWHQPSACRAGRDPMQEKDGVPQPSPLSVCISLHFPSLLWIFLQREQRYPHSSAGAEPQLAPQVPDLIPGA